MRLPSHVYELARQEHLIAKDKLAIIRIETEKGRLADNYKYEINNHSFAEAIAPFLQGEWEEFDRFFRIKDRSQIHSGDAGKPQEVSVVYSRAEHQATPKLADIMVLPNLATEEERGLARPLWVLGSTMGHFLPAADRIYRIQEVIEFQSYGLIVLDREDGQVEIWVAQEGDKVSVPNGCHTTLYNLGNEYNPLVTLSFSDPSRNESNQDLVHKCGPILLGYYDDFEVVFTLNRLYVNNPSHTAGVRLPDDIRSSEERQIRISRSARLDLGRLLHEQLTRNPEIIGRFARLGLAIKPASREAVLEPYPQDRNSRLYFSSPLAEISRKGTDVYRFFIQDSEAATPDPPPEDRQLVVRESGPNPEAAQKPEAESLGRPFVIVVEGVGDWVEQTYRELFMKKALISEKTLAVFYVDDTSWKARPAWAHPKTGDLQPWEVYLDKAKPEDFARYQNLLPDAVFVVTPDFTHSTIAGNWLNKAAMVFVEKPFDSQVINVEHLRLHLGQWNRTEILGLDHYQFYALPLHDLLPDIYDHLGGALAEVSFYLTEARPLEQDRLKSLQYGLTLDLLPHLAALLTYFGDISTVDEIVVEEAGQYMPLKASSRDGSREEDFEDRYNSETYSRVHFTFQDKSEYNFRVPCTAVVGKGFSVNAKYLEVTGINGNAVRVDLNQKPARAGDSEYPWDCVFLIQNSTSASQSPPQVRKVIDPYQPYRTLSIRCDKAADGKYLFIKGLERERYHLLLDDLLNNTSEAVVSTFSVARGQEIVRILDRVWWAIHALKSRWIRYPLGKQSPFIKVGEQPKSARGIQPQVRLTDQMLRAGKNLVFPTRSAGMVATSRGEMEEAPASVKSRRPLQAIVSEKPEQPLSDLVAELRKQVGNLPLTILLHGWETAFAGAFLTLLRPLIKRRDALWLIPASQVPPLPKSADSEEAVPVSPARERAVYLDLDHDTDRRVYNNLVPDLIYFSALEEAEAVRIASFQKRARAIVVDKRNPYHEVLQEAADKAGIPVYLWSGQVTIEGETQAPIVGPPEDEGGGGAADSLSPTDLDEIGRMLKETAEHLEHLYGRRIELRSRILNIVYRYPGRLTWGADLVHQAHKHNWPPWAVECLPAMYIITQGLPDGGARALASNYILVCVPTNYRYEITAELCNGRILEIEMPAPTVTFIEPIARIFEEQLSTLPYPSERSFVGAINNALQEVEILLREIDPRAAEKVLKVREGVLKRENVIPLLPPDVAVD